MRSLVRRAKRRAELLETENVEAVMAPNQVWVGDITYVQTDEVWLFLAIYLDLFTRKVVGVSSDGIMRVNSIERKSSSWELLPLGLEKEIAGTMPTAKVFLIR